MNSSLTQNPRPRNRRRKVAWAVSLLLLIAVNSLPVCGQSRTQKRITSVWTATTAEGSRVHVVSDSPVSDYEAYTRGGRFYVKIPAADLPSARGSLLGRGFDDVQIQRYGDGIIISFHLLPGTAGRVEQLANQLEIVFSTPGRAAAATNTVADSNRTRDRRVSDAAGPSPASSEAVRSTRPSDNRRALTTGSTPRSQSRKTEDPQASSTSASPNGRDGKSAPSATPATARSTGVATAGPSPAASPVGVASPGSTSGGSLTTPSPQNSPATAVSSPVRQNSPVQQQSPEAAADADTKPETSDWRSKAHYWKVWAELNKVPLLIAIIVIVAVLLFLFFWRGAKRLSAASAESAREYEASRPPVEEPIAPAPVQPAPSTANSASASAAGAGAGASQNQSQAQSQTHSSSPTPGQQDKHQGADPEREVFEL
jgi:hypothetical protein